MPEPRSSGTEKAPCDKQSNRGFSEEKCPHNSGVGVRSYSSGRATLAQGQTNMDKLAVRKFKTGKTFWLQKACNSQSSKVVEQSPKQQWWGQDNLVDLKIPLENKLER